MNSVKLKLEDISERVRAKWKQSPVLPFSKMGSNVVSEDGV